MKKLFYKYTTLFLGLFLLGTSPVSAEKAKAIVILDASGSMWGQIQNKTKMDIAKDVFEQLLKDWNEDIELGIMAYGHREKGNCNDIEMIYDVGKVDKNAIMSAIKKLKPKGKTPLSKAVQIAAEKLKYTEEKAVVILLSDGKETCNADPCALAKSLDEKGIDFTVHLIGFDITDSEQEELRCIAENTGGNFYRADNATQLHHAMASSVKIISKPNQGLKCQAIPTEGAKPISRDLNWSVYRVEKDTEEKHHRITGSSEPTPFFKLNQGRYLIEVRYGHVIANKEVEVKADETTNVTIILGSGQLKLQAIPTEGAQPIKNGLRWRVYEAEKYKKGYYSNHIAYSEKSVPTFTLNQGRYMVVVTYDKAMAEKVIEVKADETTQVTIILGSVQLKLQAIPTEGAQPIKSFLAG